MHFFKKPHLVLVRYSKVSCVSFRSPVLTFAQWVGVTYSRLLLEIKKALGSVSQNTFHTLGEV